MSVSLAVEEEDVPRNRAAAASSPAQSCHTWARHNFSMQKMMDLLLRVIVDDNRSEPPKFPDGEGWLFPRHYCVYQVEETLACPTSTRPDSM